MDGDLAWMPDSGRPLVQELYHKMRSQGLRPRTIVDYTREAFVYGPGNVRVTLDYDIRTGLRCTDFLDPDCITVPAGDAPAILEVKWDAFLPGIIRDAVGLPNRRAGAFSKYAACRTELFCAHAALCGADTALCRSLMDAATADACIELLDGAGLRRPVLDSLLRAVQRHLERRAAGAYQVGAVIFSNVYGPLGMTEEAKEILKQWK